VVAGDQALGDQGRLIRGSRRRECDDPGEHDIAMNLDTTTLVFAGLTALSTVLAVVQWRSIRALPEPEGRRDRLAHCLLTTGAVACLGGMTLNHAFELYAAVLLGVAVGAALFVAGLVIVPKGPK
jgi:hypothetical protein